MQSGNKPIDVLRSYPAHDGTLWQLVKSRAAVQGDRTFLVFEGNELSWNAFCEKVDQTLRLFEAYGIKAGDRIGNMAANNIDYVVLFVATAAANAVFIPINPKLTTSEAEYILGHAKPVIVFGTPETSATLHATSASLHPAPRIVILDDGLDGLLTRPVSGDSDALLHYSKSPPARQDTALILYTSGTTASPKGVMHSQGNMVMTGEYFVERLHLQPDDRLLCVLPFFHINALFYSLLGAITAGASLVIAPRFSASEFWQLAAQSRATQVNIIAAVGRILMRRPRSEFVADHNIQKLYGAPIPADIYQAFQTEFGIPTLIEGYGLTEVPGICSNPFPGPHKVGSIGIPTCHPDPDVPYARMKLVDQEGHDVPQGSVGELLVRSPIIMQGYYQDPDATAKAFQDDWFRTGDLVRQESNGYYTFIGRKKDIIRRRGENISGAELDEIVGQHPDVQVAAAIAVDSELGEDEILVVVIKRANAVLTESTLHKWCAQRLNPAKLPRYIAFVEALPYTPSHRVAKYQLRQDAELKRRAVEFTHKQKA